jgi:hypothetical protein
MDRPQAEFWHELTHKLIELLTPTANDIWTSPAKVSILIDICRDLAAIGKEAESVAINLALQQKELPGYSLVRRERAGYVESAAIAALLESLPIKEFVRVLSEVLTWSGNVSSRHYLELCQLLGREPDNNLIHPSGDSVFLRRNPQSSN